MKGSGIGEKRIEWIDAAKGLTIILMVLGHCLYLDNMLRRVIFSFHMPLFLILSGYFYKRLSWKDFFNQQIRTLGVPYAVTLLTEYFIRFLMGEMDAVTALKTGVKTIVMGLSYTQKIAFEGVPGTGVIWFFTLIFCVRLLFQIVERMGDKQVINVIIYSLVLMMAGYWLGKAGYWLPFSFDVAFYSVGFYAFGYIARQYNILEYFLGDFRVLVGCIVLWIFGIDQYLILELSTRFYSGVLTCAVVAVVGSIILFKVCIAMGKVEVLRRILNWYGKNTRMLLCFHHLDLLFVVYPVISIVPFECSVFLWRMLSISMVTLICSYAHCELKRVMKWGKL